MSRHHPLIGAQVSAAAGLLRAAERARVIGAEVIQVFPSNPRRWRPYAYSPTDLASFARTLQVLRLPLYVHAIYLVNLASRNELVRRRSAEGLAHALVFGATTGARGVVVHVGSHGSSGFEAGLRAVASTVAEARQLALSALEIHPPSALPAVACGGDFTVLPPLLLETSSGEGNTMGKTPAELAHLLDCLPGPVGLCLDTAHLFAAGHPVHTQAGLDGLLAELDMYRCLGKVGLVHLNDSKTALGSHWDRHANLGEGHLGFAGLRVALTHPALQHVPFVLEVPGNGRGPDRTNLQRAKRLRRAGVVSVTRTDSPARAQADTFNRRIKPW